VHAERSVSCHRVSLLGTGGSATTVNSMDIRGTEMRGLVCTHVRTQDGRYVVRLPVKTPLPNLFAMRRRACHMLERMESRFVKDPSFQLVIRELHAAI